MSATDHAHNGSKSDFLAAEEIKRILQGREKPEQERIIRWVSESLGLAPISISSAGGGTSAPPLAPVSPMHSPEHQHATHAPRHGKDIKAFVEEKKPKSDIQFAAVVAYFHRFEAPDSNRRETITSADLQEAARRAHWRRFKNPAVPLNNAVNQGYLDRAGGGAFGLNAVGENLVAMTLPGTDREAKDSRRNKTTVRKRSTKRRKKKKTS